MLSFLSPTSDSAYLLGFFAADGNININKNGSHYIELTSIDKNLLTAIRSHFKLQNRIGVRKSNKNWKNRYRLQIGSKGLVKELLSLGFSRKKSQRMKVPQIPHQLLPHFIRGYFDGDGNVLFRFYPRKDRPGNAVIFRVVFTSCSFDFLAQIQEKLKLHADLQSGTLRKEKNYYRLVYSSRDTLRLSYFLYNGTSDEERLFLQRKKVIFEQGRHFYGAVV